MTLVDVRDTLIHLGFEVVDNETHLSSPSGKIHIYLEPKGSPTRDLMTVKQFANLKMFGYNMPSAKNMYLICDINNIYKDGKKFVFKVNNFEKYSYAENKKETNAMNKINEEAVSTCLFEVVTNHNVRYITFTDFTRSKAEFHAAYYMDTNDWDGNKTDVNEILSALMDHKLIVTKMEDGALEFFSDGKSRLYK